MFETILGKADSNNKCRARSCARAETARHFGSDRNYFVGLVVADGGASDFFFLPFFFGAGVSSPPAKETETAPKASDRPSIKVINFRMLF